MVSLASICALGIEVITSFILYFSGRNPLSTSLALLILWAFITYRHKANIGRIAAHTESHVKWMGRELWGK
jgi:glycerol-3-phosphate acyltransferase PlsY